MISWESPSVWASEFTLFDAYNFWDSKKIFKLKFRAKLTDKTKTTRYNNDPHSLFQYSETSVIIKHFYLCWNENKDSNTVIISHYNSTTIGLATVVLVLSMEIFLETKLKCDIATSSICLFQCVALYYVFETGMFVYFR